MCLPDSALLVPLALLLPLFQKLNDGILHLFGGIGLREVLPELFALKRRRKLPRYIVNKDRCYAAIG